MPSRRLGGIVKELEELKKSFPADVDYKIPFETVTVVKVSMQEVVQTLLIALCLVALVVFLFLQNWRATLIPVSGYSCFHSRHIYLFCSIRIYNKYTDYVRFCAGYWNCGG